MNDDNDVDDDDNILFLVIAPSPHRAHTEFSTCVLRMRTLYECAPCTNEAEAHDDVAGASGGNFGRMGQWIHVYYCLMYVLMFQTWFSFMSLYN